jgi:D-arabinose 1-dehydrogenase
VRRILGEWVDYSFGSPPEGWDVEAGRMRQTKQS